MLSDEHKKEIQSAYSRLLESKGYRARFCQRKMIADIANTLGSIETDAEGERTSNGHICVVEAGTGTGKTVAYAVSALPIAKALDKRLVIATATVALQEQIVLKDLPDIAHHTGLEFSFALAKGRRRYLCLARLDQALQSGSAMNHSLSLYEDEMFGDTDESQVKLFDAMVDRLGRGEWDGERDSWPEAMEDRAWSKVSTDHVQCTGRKCSHFQNCYFYKARERIGKVDVVVTNQDLVLSDLMMGGGAVLPKPEETIYIFDEGHHLVDKAISHFSSFIQLGSTQSWLEQLPGTCAQMIAEIGNVGSLPGAQAAFEDDVADLAASLQQAGSLLEPLREVGDVNGMDRRYRFPLGRVDDHLRDVAAAILEHYQRLALRVDPLVEALEERLSDEGEDGEVIEQWLPMMASAGARLEAGASLWRDYAVADDEGDAPLARWVTFQGELDVSVNASPIEVDDTLRELLWSRCFGAVVTSATLAVAGNFDRFRLRAGIGQENTFDALLSPFDFGNQAALNVPMMTSDPRSADEHTEEITSMIPRILADVGGGLVLFSSWRQMNGVLENIDPSFRERVLAQGDLSKVEIVARHRAQVDAGQPSVIFGLASFAEGVDLPGSYCDHVIITKIPFAVPDDPVGATLSEWIEANGGNSFQQVMIPDAAIRMVQAAGRLLRTETDSGEVTILDRRLVTQRYGNLLLNAMPPYKRNIQ